MEGVYSGALADAISNYVKKRQLSGMRANPSDISAMTAGATSTWGANNRADQQLDLAKKNAADQLQLQRDTLAFNEKNAAAQLAKQTELADKNTGLQTWLAGQQLSAAQKAQPSGLDKALSYGGSAMNALALNNLAGNPLKAGYNWLSSLFSSNPVNTTQNAMQSLGENLWNAFG